MLFFHCKQEHHFSGCLAYKMLFSPPVFYIDSYLASSSTSSLQSDASSTIPPFWSNLLCAVPGWCSWHQAWHEFISVWCIKCLSCSCHGLFWYSLISLICCSEWAVRGCLLHNLSKEKPPSKQKPAYIFHMLSLAWDKLLNICNVTLLLPSSKFL